MARPRRFAAAAVYLVLTSAAGVSAQYFEDITDRAPRLTVSRSVAFGDYDNDGWVDFFLAEYQSDLFGGTSALDAQLRLTHNEGNGWFARHGHRLETDSPEDVRKGGGAIFADYDRDGDLDLYVPNGAFWGTEARGILLRNDRGRFVDVTVAAGLDDVWSTDNALWFDADRDGHIDLYRGVQDGGRHPGYHNLFHRNNGDGTFSTVEVGLESVRTDGEAAVTGGSNGGMVASDFTGDGWPDVYVGIWADANGLFVNDGTGHFHVAPPSVLSDQGQAHGIAVGDINNDGLIDLYQTAGADVNLEFRSLLMLALGGGQFVDISVSAGVAGTPTVYNAGMADVDNDGDLDLVTGSPTVLYLNDGNGLFTDATLESGFTGQPLPASVVAVGDLDRDGCLDLVFGSARAANVIEDGRLPGRVYRNTCGSANHWLRVDPVGVQSNTDAIGARVVAITGDLRQTREIHGGLGYQQDEMVVHFGLGGRERVDSLIVLWPSGATDVMTDLPVDHTVRVIEGTGEWFGMEPSRWRGSLPDTVWVGQQVSLSGAVRQFLFEPASRITSVVFEASGGVEGSTRLERSSDGSYLLDEQLTAERNGPATLQVMIDGETSVGPRWTSLSRTIAVLPAADLVVGDDGLRGWPATIDGPVQMAWAGTGPVLEGVAAAELIASPPSLGDWWTLTLQATDSPSTMGYRAMRFALHPGTVEGRPAELDLELDDAGSKRFGPSDIDWARKEWQVVEIPLSPQLGDHLEQITFAGNLNGTFYVDDIRLIAEYPIAEPTAVLESRDEAAAPGGFALHPNHPNPLNPETVIRFDLAEAGYAELLLYNTAGQRVATVMQGERAAGSYTLRWDGRDDAGRALASGVYFYRLVSGDRAQTKKLTLLR